MSGQQDEFMARQQEGCHHRFRLMIGVLIGANGFMKSDNPIIQAVSGLVFMSCLYLYYKSREESESSYSYADPEYGSLNDDDEKPSRRGYGH